MQTICLISSISFNTSAFLSMTLNRLQSSGVIDWAHWIWHEPEADEKKGHFHLLLQPSRRLDTASLQKEFIEPVRNSDKPLACLPFRKSKLRDWLLYAVHDARYLLKEKGQIRHHHYLRSDICSTNDGLVEMQWAEDCADAQQVVTDRIIELHSKGVTWHSVLTQCLFPPAQAYYWKMVWDSIDGETFRNNGEIHV